ncbi:TetR family transcriptional regulator [Bacillus coahuilensis m2-6]|uniref:TetR family transcriptional regulator n=1 Tax=Bacillus coahuilensis p1.1.43 TaxID=1150625 RepID=A0A147K453_9BACI|nr:TetR/AcrR family transcriptional regulator [Bacillus coahuilensis]KUP04091.1 TetR family transcriptional regulator [Bacillus coahuilensis p1.1.43]KUP05045.1 TetR family transcriptional regulator [Bacillus coahuilensis m2-6]
MKRPVKASVKDEKLIEIRRNQIIRGAVTLFKEKGFHRTTTREIAKAAGFSIGTLYEYIRTKEDVLYLVCDNIYDGVKEKLSEMDVNGGTISQLKQAIAYYFHLMDELQEEVLVMYQEAKSLSKDAIPYVLQKEMEMVDMFQVLLRNCVRSGEIELDEQQIYVTANDIFVQGQMWAFRRWAFQRRYTIEEYIELQTELVCHGIECKRGKVKHGNLSTKA